MFEIIRKKKLSSDVERVKKNLNGLPITLFNPNNFI